MYITFTANIPEVMKNNETVRRQMPYILSRTINDAVEDVYDDISGPVWRVAFPGAKNPRFARNAFTTRPKSTKDNLTVAIKQTVDNKGRKRLYLANHEAGGAKIKGPGGHRFAIPTVKGPKRGAYGISEKLRPKNILASDDKYFKEGNSILKRGKKKNTRVYSLAQNAKITKKFRFYTEAEHTFVQVMDHHWNKHFARVFGR